jgi:tRNA-(ms[2]io[6]A)-hydroxylase
MSPSAPPLNPTARVRWLAAPSSRSWLEQALARPDLVLIDHAHGERKAASTALQLQFRYPADPQLAAQLSPWPGRSWSISNGSWRSWSGAPSLRTLSAPAYGSSLVALVGARIPSANSIVSWRLA